MTIIYSRWDGNDGHRAWSFEDYIGTPEPLIHPNNGPWCRNYDVSWWIVPGTVDADGELVL